MKMLASFTCGLAFLASSFSALSQTQNELKPTETLKIDIYCFKAVDLAKELTTKFKEVPLLIGLTDDQAGSTTSLWFGPATRSWTIVATKNSTSCVIGSGTNLTVLNYKDKDI